MNWGRLKEWRTIIFFAAALASAQATGTTLSTIRQRWNMNAVRIPISVTQHENDASYLGRVAGVVRLAN